MKHNQHTGLKSDIGKASWPWQLELKNYAKCKYKAIRTSNIVNSGLAR